MDILEYVIFCLVIIFGINFILKGFCGDSDRKHDDW